MNDDYAFMLTIELIKIFLFFSFKTNIENSQSTCIIIKSSTWRTIFEIN